MPFWISKLGYTLVPVENHVTREDLTGMFEDLHSQGHKKIHFLHNCTPQHLLLELQSPTIFTMTESDYFVSWLPFHMKHPSISIFHENREFVATADCLQCDGEEICRTCFLLGQVTSNCEHLYSTRKSIKRKRVCQCDRVRATFGLPGTKEALWCKNCPDKPMEAIDVVSKRCVCKKAQPTLGLPGTKEALWCKHCPDKPMEAINVVHKRCVCTKAQPTLGLPGTKEALWCKNCPDKPMEAINVVNKRCVCTKAQPTFGLLGTKEALWCKNCPDKPIEAIDVKDKRCVCRKAIPIFGLPGTKEALWCKNCPDKPIEAIDVKSKCCVCTKAQPTFGLPGTKEALWCKNCPDKPMEAINVVSKRCVCTKAQPTLGLPGTKEALWCKNCPDKPMEAINVKDKRCVCTKARPSFGLPGTKEAIWCKNCPDKPMEAINIKSKRCVCTKAQPTLGLPGTKEAIWCKNCPDKPMEAISVVTKRCVCTKARPTFGLADTKEAIWCNNCPEKPMEAINVVNKRCSCDERAYYALMGFAEICCNRCKKPGMVPNPRKQCSIKTCRYLAIYGVKSRLHCETHKEPEERNLVERECSSCKLFNVLNEQNICEYCDPTKFKTFTQRKELHVRDVLDANHFTGYRHNKIPNGTECGKDRPDFVWELNAHVVILEVDERQHESYSCVCEQTRMVNISQTFGGKPVFWIRYNPDDFHLPSGQKSDITKHKREHHLLEWLTYAHKTQPKQYIEIIYLFYDKCNDRSMPDDIQNVTSWEQS